MVPPIVVKSNEHSIGLDNGKGDFSFYSHAHKDHIRGAKTAKRPFSSKETAVLANIRNTTPPNCVEMFNAGHMPGANQILIKTNAGNVIYTGDIKLKDSILTRGGDIVYGDYLIIDATYGIPGLRFPDPFDVYESISKWVDENRDSIIIFKTYVLGKPQELIKVMNDYNGITPKVSKRVYDYSLSYKKINIDLNFSKFNTENVKEGDVIIASTGEANSIITQLKGKNIKVATATGWSMLYRMNVDKAFPLSDHADFHEIVDYINAIEPKKVFFITSKASRGISKKITKYVKTKAVELSAAHKNI